MSLPGSGATTIVYNTRERVVSADPNRAQAKAAQQLADILRFMLDATNEQDVTGGGVEVLGTGSETFLRGTILNGIRVRPEIGTINCFVTPGVALLIDNPSPGVDDSVAAYVDDPGVTLAGALVLTAGAGSTRIDVVECQRVTNVFEQDNRDVFNVSTGLFTPTQVTKVQGGQLVYRIRTGTPGSGFPGVVAGWMPLMIASVPAGATTWNDCVCWDVRPLASDRTNGPFATARFWNPEARALLATDCTTNAAQVRINGEVDLTYGGYKAGGLLRKNSTTPWIDITDTDNQAAGFGGFGTTTATLWYLYLVFPFGLPRWVRYSDFGSGFRQPGMQRGIPAVSSAPCQFNGTPRSNTVNTATSTGLLDPAAGNAICVAVGRGPKAGGTVPFGPMSDGKVMMLVNLDAWLIAPSTNNTSLMTWTFTDDTHFSGQARAVWVRFHAEFQFPNPAASAQGVATIAGEITMTDQLANPSYIVPAGDVGMQTCVDSDPGGAGATPGVLFKREMVVRIPLQPSFNPNPAARTFKVTWTHNAGIAATTESATILGYELGP